MTINLKIFIFSILIAVRYKVHVDKIFAVKNSIIPIVGVLSVIVALFVTVMFWDYGFVSALSFAFPIVAIKSTQNNEQNKMKAFNLMFYD